MRLPCYSGGSCTGKFERTSLVLGSEGGLGCPGRRRKLLAAPILLEAAHAIDGEAVQQHDLCEALPGRHGDALVELAKRLAHHRCPNLRCCKAGRFKGGRRVAACTETLDKRTRSTGPRQSARQGACRLLLFMHFKRHVGCRCGRCAAIRAGALRIGASRPVLMQPHSHRRRRHSLLRQLPCAPTSYTTPPPPPSK
jgi:hypothetical protein